MCAPASVRSIRQVIEKYEAGKRGVECGHDKDFQANCFAKVWGSCGGGRGRGGEEAEVGKGQRWGGGGEEAAGEWRVWRGGRGSRRAGMGVSW